MMNSDFKEYVKMLILQQPKYDNDYIIEDVLYCGNCNTPKREYQTFGNEKIQVPILCKCQKEKTEKYKEQKRREDEQQEINRLRQKGLPELFHSYTFANDNHHNQDVTDVCNNYVSRFGKMQEHNLGIIFCGNVGSGKTFYACMIANALIDKLYSVKLVNLPMIINKLQQTFDKDEIIQELLRYDLLIFDDIGVERNSDFVNEQIYTIINARYETKKPFLVTTNIPRAELENPKNVAHERIYSRILQVCSTIKKVANQDQRLENAEEKRKLAKEILSE